MNVSTFDTSEGHTIRRAHFLTDAKLVQAVKNTVR